MIYTIACGDPCSCDEPVIPCCGNYAVPPSITAPTIKITLSGISLLTTACRNTIGSASGRIDQFVSPNGVYNVPVIWAGDNFTGAMTLGGGYNAYNYFSSAVCGGGDFDVLPVIFKIQITCNSLNLAQVSVFTEGGEDNLDTSWTSEQFACGTTNFALPNEGNGGPGLWSDGLAVMGG